MFLFYKTLLRGGKNLKRSYGEWAVVTGATDGIGKATLNLSKLPLSTRKLDLELADKLRKTLLFGFKGCDLALSTLSCGLR